MFLSFWHCLLKFKFVSREWWFQDWTCQQSHCSFLYWRAHFNTTWILNVRSSTNWKPLVPSVLQNENKLHASWFLLNHSIKLKTITILFCVFSPKETASMEQRKINWFPVTNCWKQEDSSSFHLTTICCDIPTPKPSITPYPGTLSAILSLESKWCYFKWFCSQLFPF